MLGAELGFCPDFEQSAAYVEGWLKTLNDDTSMIFRAASEAQKAVDFINAKAGKVGDHARSEVAA